MRLSMGDRKYKCLKNQTFSNGIYNLVPIRDEDRFLILKWRNEQIYHLRQSKLLTELDQEWYFENVISKLFDENYPGQILFSFLENDKCIGYGGLVHINWGDKNAEISFIMDTALERSNFHKLWNIYLGLIEKVAFRELSFHKIYTYAFDLRPHLYEAIEAVGFEREAVLKEHCLFDGQYRNVVIHSKLNRTIKIREMLDRDKDIIFEWANDSVARRNSFNSEPIKFEDHSTWFDRKLSDNNAYYYICEVNEEPAGLVRFDVEGQNAVIGILIDKHYRGKGLATNFLKLSCEKFRSKSLATINAYIKNNNEASIRVFEQAGFSFVKAVEIHNNRALKYELK